MYTHSHFLQIHKYRHIDTLYMHTHSHISYTYTHLNACTQFPTYICNHTFSNHAHIYTSTHFLYTHITHAYPFTDFLHTHTHTFPIHVTHAHTCTHFLHTNTYAHAHIGFVGIKTWFHAIYTSLHLILFLSQHMVHIQTIFGEDEWSWASFHIHTYRYASFLLAAA